MDYLMPRPDLYHVPYEMDDFNGMPYRWIGRSGLRASDVGLRTWKYGLPETGDGARVDERTAFAIFDRAIELGVTFWDTANRYNNASGNSERLIGRWLKANPDQRRNVVIATKVYGGMDGRTPNHCRLSRGNILDAAPGGVGAQLGHPVGATCAGLHADTAGHGPADPWHVVPRAARVERSGRADSPEH